MTVLYRSTDLGEGQAHSVNTEQRDIVLVRRHGRVYAYLNRCPHTGINLEWLPDQFFDTSGEYLQCAMHGALFRVEDGHCVNGPCAGDALQKLRVIERDGYICLEPGEA